MAKAKYTKGSDGYFKTNVWDGHMSMGESTTYQYDPRNPVQTWKRKSVN